jgi:light-regulated signal transduction histidine kinase (bacteriophytochrome)
VIQFRWLARDGRVIPVEAHSVVIYNEAGLRIGMRGVTMDISQRRRAQDALELYAEQLRRSNEELQQFAYVTSHDLQEPLRAITSYLQLIEERYRHQLDKDAKEFIDFAVEGAKRMKMLISDLLAYSRIDTHGKALEETDSQKVLDSVLGSFQLLIAENAITIRCDPMPQLLADKIQLTQLFQNLISNAIKFRGESPPELHIGAKRQGDSWLFSVSDNGIGIEQKYMTRIFELFQRLHAREEYEGTGIGLAICKKVVERHGGHIWVESEVGKGTTFYFTIPDRPGDLRPDYANYAG